MMDTPTAPTDSASSSETAALLQQLEEEVAFDRKLNITARKRLIVAGMIAVIAMISRFWSIGKDQSLQVVTILFQVATNFLVTGMLGMTLRQRQKRSRRRSEIFDKLQDEIAAVGNLTQIVAARQPDELSKLGRAVLKKLLLRLQPGDIKRFSAEQLTALHNLLPNDDTDLALAVIRALEQIGDGRAVEPMERLIKQTKKEAVRKAAEACLPFLRVKAEEQERAKTLLRPSMAAGSSPESLLRPAVPSSSHDAQEQLLRPLE